MLFIKKCYAARPPIESFRNHYQPLFTSHSPLMIFLNRIDRLSMPTSKINPVDHSQWPECPHPTPPCRAYSSIDVWSRVLGQVPRGDQPNGNAHCIWQTVLYVTGVRWVTTSCGRGAGRALWLVQGWQADRGGEVTQGRHYVLWWGYPGVAVMWPPLRPMEHQG
jgi:hypothetical protein